MYTLWNPEPDAQELLVTLKYGDGQLYKLPVTLEPHASAMVDIGELIRTQQLDQDGKILPPDVKHGSLVVSSPANEPEDAIDVVVGMGIYNPTKATCGGGCITCNGMVDPYMSPGPPACAPVGEQLQLTFGYNDNLGHRYNVSGWSNWSSSASQVMSVQTAGQPTPGLATAHLSGSTMLSMYDGTPVAVDAGQVCMQGIQPFCPVTTFQDGGTGCGQPMIGLIQPSKVGVGNPNLTIVLTGSGFGYSPLVNIDGIGSYQGYGGGDQSTTVTFSTNGASLGDHLVTVTANGQTTAIGNAKILKVVCAVPVNFRQYFEQCQASGNLQFKYTWDSSTGSQADIAACYVGELVTYNGTATPPPLPFPPNSGFLDPTTNPTLKTQILDNNAIADNNLPPVGSPQSFVKPYRTASFTGTQEWRYNCPCQGSAQVYIPFPGYAAISIAREVTISSGGIWQYFVTKQGYTCSLNLP